MHSSPGHGQGRAQKASDKVRDHSAHALRPTGHCESSGQGGRAGRIKGRALGRSLHREKAGQVHSTSAGCSDRLGLAPCKAACSMASGRLLHSSLHSRLRGGNASWRTRACKCKPSKRLSS